MIELTSLEAALRRDRVVVLAGLAALTLAAWTYIVYLGLSMTSVGAMEMAPNMAMPQLRSWGAVELLLLFVMWAVMMVAMMVPSVAPLILMLTRASRRKGIDQAVGSAASLLLGYLIVSGLAALTQWSLHRAALLSPMMASTSPVLGGGLLVAAGVFQFTPLKRACLGHCRSPMSFLLSHWSDGRGATLVMGLKHGAYCVGCCWLLMALLFITGVMNLLWVAVIAGFVLVEKTTTLGGRLSRIAGGALIVAGIALLV